MRAYQGSAAGVGYLDRRLGRPGGYTSKAAFTDTRVDPAQARGSESIDRGGGVEVFATAQAAQQRGQYVQRVAQAVPLLGSGYVYAAGPVLLRLTGVLIPPQAEENVSL